MTLPLATKKQLDRGTGIKAGAESLRSGLTMLSTTGFNMSQDGVVMSGADYTGSGFVYMSNPGQQMDLLVSAIPQLTTAVQALIPMPVAAVTVVTPGSGYTSTPTVTISGGDGTGLALTPVLSGGDTGTLTAIAITNPGSGYTVAPTITVSGGGAVTQATATAVVPQVTLAQAIAVVCGS